VSLEEQIIEWSASRPDWQREVLKRVASGQTLSDKDYDSLVDLLLSPSQSPHVNFGLIDFPQVNVGDPAVLLISVSQPEHVNALSSDKPLTFGEVGLTIIYGDNGSGKSGYARLLKRIARSRHHEEVLSDVFKDTVLSRPKAALAVRVGSKEVSLIWPDSTPPELQRMIFYDCECGKAYVAVEADFPYRPTSLFVMDGLIEACIAIRTRIDMKLEENARSAKVLPVVDNDIRNTEGGRYLAELSGRSSVEFLAEVDRRLNEFGESLTELREQEARLLSGDPSKERQKLIRQAEKLEALQTDLARVEVLLDHSEILSIQEERNQLAALEQAAGLLAESFDSEPLAGVGTSPWKALWEAARRFSELHAYPSSPFPVTGHHSACVLCQQALEPEAQLRLSGFEEFVRTDTETKYRDAQTRWNAKVKSLTELRTLEDTTKSNLIDLEADQKSLVGDARHRLSECERVRASIVEALASGTPIPDLGPANTDLRTRINEAATTVRTTAEKLSDAVEVKKHLAKVTSKRKELELLQNLKEKRDVVIHEIDRLKSRAILEAVKNTAATGPITNKILELSEENITDVVRDTFTRETERLLLERVTITKTRADRGAVLHQPKLLGLRQSVTLPRVLSEGERTALGLAVFFTEAELNASKSAVILDDPVSSLDHIRRGLVATRLAKLAETRQVVVFTHDVSFVAALKREANGMGVPTAERSVAKGRGTEKRPGACGIEHPWKARDVAERLGQLQSELALIKRMIIEWDETVYETTVASWAGKLSETWERIFSQEIVGPILAEGGLEVHVKMVKVLVRFSDTDEREFQASYSRVSEWAKRHDKSGLVNYVAPTVGMLENELNLVRDWFNRVRKYKA